MATIQTEASEEQDQNGNQRRRWGRTISALVSAQAGIPNRRLSVVAMKASELQDVNLSSSP
jgi:hypothetical protein